MLANSNKCDTSAERANKRTWRERERGREKEKDLAQRIQCEREKATKLIKPHEIQKKKKRRVAIKKPYTSNSIHIMIE